MPFVKCFQPAPNIVGVIGADLPQYTKRLFANMLQGPCHVADSLACQKLTKVSAI